ncbi:MAG: hypothetical protein L0Y58_25950 [Verrucomicrobia subdivision 3 bacterium]|nr:hypothetical protein [Limisphaerales bacterium]
MKKQGNKSVEQPAPFTPGITKGMVRQHALELYRDKLTHNGVLTLEDWVMAEKDLVNSMAAEDLPQR